MNFFRDQKIGVKIFGLLILSLIVPIIIGTYSYLGFVKINHSTNTIYNDRLIPIEDLNNLVRRFKDILIEIEYIQKHNPQHLEYKLHDHTIDRHLQKFREYMQQAKNIYLKYSETYLTQEEKQLADELKVKMDDYLNHVNILIEKFKKEDYKNVYIFVFNTVHPKYNSVRDVTDKLINLQIKVANEEKIMSVQIFNNIKINSIIIIVLANFSILFLGIFLYKSIISPIHLAIHRIKDIAEGEGDLTKRINMNSKDELGELGQWIDKFIDKIYYNVHRILEVSIDLSKGADMLQEASFNVSSGSEQMSKQSEIIAAATTQMNQNIQIITSSIEESSNMLSETAKKAENASSIIKNADNLAMQTEDVINDLNHSAKEIGKVINSIAGIAAQTNLLALNASIEAAGAGDAGRGFAIVATEVKELARQASVSSDEIKTKIVAIQKNTEKTIHSIHEIVEIMSKINEISNSITVSVSEQSKVSSEVAQNISHISIGSEEVAQNVTGISTAAREGSRNSASALKLSKDLQKLAHDLNTVVNSFRI